MAFPLVWVAAAGLAGLLGGAAIVHYWDNILEWLNDFLPKISSFIRELGRKFKGNFEHVADMIADKIDSTSAKISHRLYHKQKDGQWVEEKTSRTLPESELPASIKRKLAMKRREADITEEMELETGCAIS